MATLSGLFGALAALIATIGLYGVMAYMSRGAGTRSGSAWRSGRIARRRDEVMREAAVLLAAGVIVGLVMAVIAPRRLDAVVRLEPGDPATLDHGGAPRRRRDAGELSADARVAAQPAEALREE